MLRANPERFPDFLLRLKAVSRTLIIAEVLDVATTLLGFLFFPQIWEVNPMLEVFGGWSQLLLIKLFLTTAVVFVLERINSWPRLVWVIPLVAAIPPIWNTICLLAEAFWSFFQVI